MKRLTSLLTVFCFFLVTFLEKGAIVLCIVVSYGFGEPVQAEPKKQKCNSSCETESSCGPIVPETSTKTETKEERFCQIFMETSETFKNLYKCNLTKLNLTATYEQYKTDDFGADEICPGKIYCNCDQSANLLIDQSRPRGVNPIISTTVLRL